jgi:hypothetical protein
LERVGYQDQSHSIADMRRILGATLAIVDWQIAETILPIRTPCLTAPCLERTGSLLALHRAYSKIDRDRHRAQGDLLAAIQRARPLVAMLQIMSSFQVLQFYSSNRF